MVAVVAIAVTAGVLSGTKKTPIKAGPDTGTRGTGTGSTGDTGAVATTSTAPPAPTVSTLLAGNATPSIPAGAPGKLAIVFVGAPVISDSTTTVPVIVVNESGSTVNDIDVSGPATVNGSVVASGDSQGFSPKNVPNGAAAFGYVFFESAVPSGAQFSGLTVNSSDGQSTYFIDGQVSGVSLTTGSFGGQAVVGTVTNTNSGTMTGPVGADVLCFDGQGSFLSVQTGFTSGNGDIPAGGTASFETSLIDTTCPTFLVGSSGFGQP